MYLTRLYVFHIESTRHHIVRLKWTISDESEESCRSRNIGGIGAISEIENGSQRDGGFNAEPMSPAGKLDNFRDFVGSITGINNFAMGKNLRRGVASEGRERERERRHRGTRSVAGLAGPIPSPGMAIVTSTEPDNGRCASGNLIQT